MEENKVWAVVYLPNKEGLIFARLKPEIMSAFEHQEDAIEDCRHWEQCGYLDELHYGYRVRQINQSEVPTGMHIG